MAYCSYLNCHNKQTYGIPRFLVPQDHRREDWIKKSGNKYLHSLPKTTKIYFCADHFDSKYINTSLFKSRLSWFAVPKHFMGDDRDSEQSLSFHLNENINPTVNIDKNSESESFNFNKKNKPKTYKNPFLELSPSGSNTINESQFPQPDIQKTVELQVPIKKYEVPTAELLCSPKKKKLKPNQIMKSEQKTALNKLLDGRSSSVKTFVNVQTLHTSNSKWTVEEKDLFLKFHYRSPSFYKFLIQEGFTLPSVSTIVRWYNTIEFTTGISVAILKILKEKLKDTAKFEKRCILVFDEMSIKTELEYSKKGDIVYGFTDLGELGRERSFANYALLFMLRGLNSSWKQVIGYYSGSVRGTQLSQIIKSTLTLLIENEIDVQAVICDQGSSNRTAYKQLGVSLSKPYIEILNRKFFFLFDIIHLFKSFRNNLLKTNLIIGEDVVSWSVLVKLFYAENSLIRSMHKLTEAHIKPDTFQKMRVKLATQIFSHHVSTAIYAAAHTNLFSESEKAMAISTGNFFFRLNKLFDNLTSKSKYTSNPNNCALSEETEEILENLRESAILISTWKKSNGVSEYCFSGMQQTINGIIQLWNVLKGVEQKYILTANLNSDCIENTISVIRNNRGSYERNPSALRLHKNLKEMCFYHIMTTDTTSYNHSDTRVLLNIEDITNFVKSHEEITDVTFEEEIDEIPLRIIPLDVNENENITYESALQDEYTEESNYCEYDDSDIEDNFESNPNDDTTINNM